MGGIAFRAPVLAALFLVVALATLAMPGSANFVGEFLILLGVFNSKIAIAFIASIGVILASVYALRMYIRAVHNRSGPTVPSVDLTLRDAAGDRRRSCWRSSPSRVFPQRALEPGEPAVRASVAGGAARTAAR